MSGRALASAVSANALPPNEPVPSLTKRIIELLRVEKEDLVVDLYCRDLQYRKADVLEEIRPRDLMIAPSLFGERLGFALATSGVRIVQMGTPTLGRYPMRYEKVLVRDGFSQFKGTLRRLLGEVFSQLDPAGRVLIVDSAPSSDAPLFAEGRRRWKKQHRSPQVIAELMEETGFSTQVEAVDCLRRVSSADCYGWVESRSWPILESFQPAELLSGLCELRTRYGSQRMVEFTSRFDLVLGTKPEALAS